MTELLASGWVTTAWGQTWDCLVSQVSAEASAGSAASALLFLAARSFSVVGPSPAPLGTEQRPWPEQHVRQPKTFPALAELLSSTAVYSWTYEESARLGGRGLCGPFIPS